MQLLDDAGDLLDGTFELAKTDDGFVLTLHAKGGSKKGSITNGDYNVVLELLLERLGGIGISILDVSVDSAPARKLALGDRRLAFDYPVALDGDTDFRTLRIAITEGQRDIASARPKGSPGGNKHKRIRIALSSAVGIESIIRTLNAGTPTALATERRTFGATYFDDTPSLNVASTNLFTRDESKLERSLEGHAETQRLLAEYVRDAGLEPRKRSSGEPDFDIGWRTRSGLVVAEVKSLKNTNLSKQLRVGIGQVLQYRYLLEELHLSDVFAVLAVEHDPGDPWPAICSQAGIALVWPPGWNGLADLLVTNPASED